MLSNSNYGAIFYFIHIYIYIMTREPAMKNIYFLTVYFFVVAIFFLKCTNGMIMVVGKRIIEKFDFFTPGNHGNTTRQKQKLHPNR